MHCRTDRKVLIKLKIKSKLVVIQSSSSSFILFRYFGLSDHDLNKFKLNPSLEVFYQHEGPRPSEAIFLVKKKLLQKS
jgi:hypothetical protein